MPTWAVGNELSCWNYCGRVWCGRSRGCRTCCYVKALSGYCRIPEILPLGEGVSAAYADVVSLELNAWVTMSTSSLALFVLPCAPCSVASRLCSGALDPV